MDERRDGDVTAENGRFKAAASSIAGDERLGPQVLVGGRPGDRNRRRCWRASGLLSGVERRIRAAE